MAAVFSGGNKGLDWAPVGRLQLDFIPPFPRVAVDSVPPKELQETAE